MDWDSFYHGALVAGWKYRPQDAEDLAQEASLRALRYSVDNPSNAQALGYTMVRNLAYSLHRHEKRFPQVELDAANNYFPEHNSERDVALSAWKYLKSELNGRMEWLLTYYTDGETKRTKAERAKAYRIRQKCKKLLLNRLLRVD